MADAKADTTRKVEVTGYTLELTKEEAELILTLTGNILGDRHASPRKHSDSVYYALKQAGVKLAFQGHLSGSLRFSNTSGSSLSF
ncbi:hypothetical protein ACWDWS_02255 [Streptomyces sp. NPDC003328]